MSGDGGGWDWSLYSEVQCITGNSHMCNGEKGTLTFVHWSHQCTSSQGPPGLGYGPSEAVVWPLQAGKAIAEGFLPTAVARDVMSYVSY